jgi:transcriptional regulator with XRE-family HTH domain
MLAEQTGIADATLSRIERNRLTPSVRLAEKVARELGVRVDDLFETPKEPKKSTLRPCEAKLLALVRHLDDAAVDDITKGVKLIVAAARRS